MVRWLFAAWLLLCAAPAEARVWIVDARGGGDFTDLPAAVAAAAPNDVLLVRWGSYSGARITRGLTIRGLESTAFVAELRSPMLVESLPGNERVALQGLRRASYPTGSTALAIVRRCSGTVQIEECDGRLSGSPPPTATEPSIQVEGSLRVILRNCIFHGARRGSATEIPAARFSNSTVLMYGCLLLGGSGASCAGERGGLALEASGCTLLLSGCRIVGGTGSSGYCTAPIGCSTGSGGAGAFAAGSRILDYGSVVEGGWEGIWYCIFTGPPQRNGSAWSAPPAVHLRDAEPLPAMTLGSPLGVGSSLRIDLELHSPNPQLVFLSLAPAAYELRGIAGVLWIDPASAFFVGATSASVGLASLAIPVPSDPLARGVELHFQVVDTRGRLGACSSGVLW